MGGMKKLTGKKGADYLLIFGLAIGLSVLFQIYWTNVLVSNGVLYVKDGGLQRFLLKIIALLLIYGGLFKFLTVRAISYNFILKIPLLFYLSTVIVVFPFTYTNAYVQSMNLVLFAPLLCLDLRGEEGREIFMKIAKIIICVVCLQLVIDLMFKAFGLSLINTLLGGMGNANTFGIHLIVAGLGLRFIYKQHLLSNIVLLFTWGTGSLACVSIASIFIFQSILINLWKNTLGIIILVVGIVVSVSYMKESILTGDFGPLLHAYMKVEGAIIFLFYGSNFVGAGSFSGRTDYIMQGLQLMSDNPLSLFFGHPDLLPFYSGDGFYVALLVTLGIPALVLFIICNLYTIYRGLSENTPLSNFAAYVLLAFMLIFASNRILDYWPSGLIYMLALSYLVRDRTFSD